MIRREHTGDMTALRRLAIAAAILTLTTACSSTKTTAPLTISVCGTVFSTGGVTPTVTTLSSPASGSEIGLAPTHSLVPPLQQSAAIPAVARYLRTSSSCTDGAVVTISPIANARLYGIAYSTNRKISAIVLTVLGGPVTVSAWQGDRLTGTEKLSPAG
jgi:hypothetical protein